MNLPYFIARRLIRGRIEKTSFSRPINIIAIVGIAMGLAVMIIAVAVLTGFKQQIRDKIVGFGSNIQILNFDSNLSLETIPVSDTQAYKQFGNSVAVPVITAIAENLVVALYTATALSMAA